MAAVRRWLPVGDGARQPRRWAPVAGLALVVVVGVVLIVTLTGGQPAPAAGSQTGAAAPNTGQPTGSAQGLPLTQQAADSSPECARHAYGDVQSWLLHTGCLHLDRAVFSTTDAAAAVAELRFATPATAAAFLTEVRSPGSGGITDLVAEGKRWPGGPSSFDNAALRGRTDGATVRIVAAVYAKQPSSPDDPALNTLAERVLYLPK